MVRGGCQSVRGAKGIELKYDADLCVWEQRKRDTCYDQMNRLWLMAWDGLGWTKRKGQLM